VAPTVTSTYQVSAFDGYNTVTGSVTVTVIPLPVADAGVAQSIPYGTYTFLNGSALNGNNYMYYSWSPADKLINAGIQNPKTVNLTATTVYSLEVTDLMTNCVSTNPATVAVEVTGGPLNVNPVATPASICKGDTTRLHASAGGGNVGFYAYSWSSNPPGFTSTAPEPLVHPLVYTTYSVTVTDQFNNITGNTSVSIYPEPVIHLGPPDTTVCIYDTVKLNAGNPGSTYLWSNGSVDKEIWFGTTGIGYDMQTYSVEVINEHGCKSNATINVIFSADMCVGINDILPDSYIRIYPNPARDVVRIDVDGISGATRGSLMTPLGKVLREFSFADPAGTKSSFSLGLNGLAKGVYLVRFDNSSFVHVQKLVIE
jgi:hypothetical protein